jgi:HlyD family secretion protein
MNKKIIILLVIFIIGLSVFYLYQRSNPQEVTYIRVQQVDYYDKILTTGTVLLEGLTEIKTEVSGKIVELQAVEGDEVKQGQILLKFETIDVYLDLKQAEASYSLAKSRYDEIVNTTCPTSQEQYRQAQLATQELQEKVIRYERLYSQQAIAQDRLEEARHQLELQQSTTEIQKKFMESCAEGGAKRETALAEMKSAQTRIDLLKNRLDKHTILSPINGIIIEQYKSLGEYAMIGESLFSIAEKNSKYIEIELDERNIPRISLNQTVFVSTEFSPENKIEGMIYYIAPSVNSDKGTVQIKVKLIEDNDYLIKNLTVRCEIIYAEYPNALVIPQEYIVRDEEYYFVFSIRDGRAEKKKLLIDNPNAQEIRIIEGVQFNEIIVNPAGLQDGMEIVLKD